MKHVNISLIIPTYKREKQINKKQLKLEKQINRNYKLEILICDSNSNYKVKLFPKNKKNFKVRYLNISKNNLSAKRNYGIKKAKYKNIILIDDDCIPVSNFLISYLKDFNRIDQFTILSGIVDYPNRYISNYNHIKYRNRTHFKISDIQNKEIEPDKIVAMNLGFINNSNMSKLKYFNDKFTGYGFEDHEFAHRYKKNGFKLLQTRAKILHDEGTPNINNYIKKYYHLARDGMRNLISIDKSLAKKTIYNRIEQNFIFKIITKIPKINYLLLFLEKLIISTDKLKNMKFLSLYSLLRLCSYTRGYIDRNNKKLNLKTNSWYE